MIFSKEALREMNFKTELIRKAEVLRKSDNVRYSKLIEKYKAEHGRLLLLPIEKLKELVGEIESLVL